MKPLVEVRDMCKIYNPGENEVRALDHVSLTIDQGEFVGIIGHSGSGKSTLMNMLGCLDIPTSGSYYLNGKDVSHMADDELSDIRNVEIGFNNRYLLDALRNAEGDEVKVQLNGPLSPMKVLPREGNAFLFLVLPVRLKSDS